MQSGVVTCLDARSLRKQQWLKVDFFSRHIFVLTHSKSLLYVDQASMFTLDI